MRGRSGALRGDREGNSDLSDCGGIGDFAAVTTSASGMADEQTLLLSWIKATDAAVAPACHDVALTFLRAVSARSVQFPTYPL